MKIENLPTTKTVDRNSSTWKIIKNVTKNVNQEEAFYVCNLNEIIDKHRIWTEFLPRVEPHYAVKCNDDKTVLEVLGALGVSFDCASRAEIAKVLSCGVKPHRIIFANPAKPQSHIRYAAASGVTMMTFDSDTELQKVQVLHPAAELVIRIRVDATEALCPLGMKFGCDPVREAPRLLRVARSLNLNVIGVSFHVGSGCLEPAVYRRAISASKDIFDYARTLGFEFSLLDIGGGYPGSRDSSISEIAAVVNDALDDFFSDGNVRFIAEPGRFYVTSAYTLACNIHSVRKITHEDDKGQQVETHRMYFINDGVYGSFNCLLYDHQVAVPVLLKDHSEAKTFTSSVWGPSCDGLDQIIEEMSLPDLTIGDWMVFENMGAYTLPIASPFNGFPVPKVIYMMNQKEWCGLKHLVSLSRADMQIVEDQVSAKEDLYCLKIPSAEYTGLRSAAKPVALTAICPELMVG